ncbi:hypothetical protein T492DRAFT_1021969 [Pavlovales sp. CCMP2436]|nr:hypothetical protein T492DRAFT_1021969 [Pavlovales sp. CCMP2436]
MAVPLSTRSSSCRTQCQAVRAVSLLRSQNALSCVQTPLPRLTSSTSLACRARRATWGASRRARWSAGYGTDSTARPRHSKREARDHREAAGVSPIEHIEYLEYHEKCLIDLACASSPAGAQAVRARREGAPGGGGGGSCLARRTSKVGLGKMDERQAQFVLIHKASTTRPSLGRRSSRLREILRLGAATPRALLFRRTVASR